MQAKQIKEDAVAEAKKEAAEKQLAREKVQADLRDKVNKEREIKKGAETVSKTVMNSLGGIAAKQMEGIAKNTELLKQQSDKISKMLQETGKTSQDVKSTNDYNIRTADMKKEVAVKKEAEKATKMIA